MSTYRVMSIIDGEPTFAVPVAEIWAACELGGAVEVHSPAEYHSAQQRKWYKGIAVRALADYSGYTPEEADYIIKGKCGHDLLKTETIYLGRMSNGQPIIVQRPTIVGVGKRNMTAFIDNIISAAIDEGWPILPPADAGVMET